jgi:hypothetical protein
MLSSMTHILSEDDVQKSDHCLKCYKDSQSDHSSSSNATLLFINHKQAVTINQIHRLLAFTSIIALVNAHRKTCFPLTALTNPQQHHTRSKLPRIVPIASTRLTTVFDTVLFAPIMNLLLVILLMCPVECVLAPKWA